MVVHGFALGTRQVHTFLTDCMDHIIARLDALADELPATIYRTARRLLDRTDPTTGYCRISYDEMAEIAMTANDDTARSHLIKLARLDLITYKRNAAVHVMWHGWQEEVIDLRANRANYDQGTPYDEEIPAEPARVVRANRANYDHLPDEATDETADENHNSREPRAKRANQPTKRANYHQPNRQPSKQAGLEEDTACLPAGGSGGEDPPDPGGDFERAVDLLTDPDGPHVDRMTAERWAKGRGFDQVAGQVFRYLREIQAGRKVTPGVIGSRLERGYAGQVTDADRASPLYRRHCLEDWEYEERRRKYVPDEYADVIRH